MFCTMIQNKTDFKSRNRLWTKSWNVKKGESPTNFPSSAYYLPSGIVSLSGSIDEILSNGSQIRMLPAVCAVLA